MGARGFAELLELAILEDGDVDGDVTSQAIFTDQVATAAIVSRGAVCLAGIAYAVRVFDRIDPRLVPMVLKQDGQAVQAGEEVMTITGPVASLLKAERIALNFMAYLSGIATQTREFVAIARSLGDSVVLDTRKTLPGYRFLAKEAIVLGGGQNHRMGLYDMVMIKDNHIDAAGGIGPAVALVRKRWNKRFRIEVECRNLDEVRQALDLAVDVIMLDNMDERAASEALILRKKEYPGTTCTFEASGDMDLDKLRKFAGLGIDYISVGRLTHSVMAANFSMQIRT